MAVTKLNLNNKLINGSFDYWQRGTSFNSAAGTNATYTADRFKVNKIGTFTGTTSRSTDIPSGSVSTYSLLYTVGTAQVSLGAGDFNLIQQPIEGNILRSVKSKKIVLRFWVKSSIAGTFNVSMVNGIANRSYVQRFTINAVNTWELKTMRFTHDASGTWSYDNSLGSYLQICLGSGSTYIGVEGWQNGNILTTAASTNLMATAGATFQLSDICLVEDNEGQTRTPDFCYAGRDIIEEFQLCERYFETSARICLAVNATAVYHQLLQFRTRKRSVPTMSTTAIGGAATINLSGPFLGLDCTSVAVTGSSANIGISFTYLADAEL